MSAVVVTGSATVFCAQELQGKPFAADVGLLWADDVGDPVTHNHLQDYQTIQQIFVIRHSGQTPFFCWARRFLAEYLSTDGPRYRGQALCEELSQYAVM